MKIKLEDYMKFNMMAKLGSILCKLVKFGVLVSNFTQLGHAIQYNVCIQVQFYCNTRQAASFFT